MPTLAAIVSNLVSVAAALGMIVLLLAGGANASPETIARIKWMSIGVGVVTLGAIAISAWLAAHGRPWHAAGVGLAPGLLVVVLLIVLMKLEW
jgi:Kef-type K+ transport system membrane component KefB